VKAWFLLLRPWSYTATLVPFLAVAGLCRGRWSVCCWSSWGLGLFAGLCLQATVNLLNTWGDERSGVDDVPGAIRTTPQVHDGLVSMRAVLAAAVAAAVLGVLAGAAACVYVAANTPERVALGGGWHLNVPALTAGALGILGATNYSTGVKFKYRGLGVPFVSALMGPIEMFAALALASPQFAAWLFWGMLGCDVNSASFLAKGYDGIPFDWVFKMAIMFFFFLWTFPVASLVGVIMHGNDMRDISSDRAAGIVTFASRLGPRGALVYYCAAHIAPYVVCVLLSLLVAWVMENSRWSWAVFLIPFLCLPLTVRTLCTACRVYAQNPTAPPWRGLERASGLVHLVFGVLYAASWASLASIR